MRNACGLVCFCSWVLANMWVAPVSAGGPSDHEQARPALLFPVFQKGKWGYIDNRGKLVIEPGFRAAGPFREGLARVCSEPAYAGYGFIDRAGQYVVLPKFVDCGPFSEGLARVNIGGRWDLSFDSDPKRWASYTRMAVFGGRWGFIDPKGKAAIEPKFDEVGDFSEGLAPVRVGRKWGYVGKSGRMAIKAQFDAAGPFWEGLASTRIGGDLTGLFGFIDKTGKAVIEAKFDLAGNFREGLAPVRVLTSENVRALPGAGRWWGGVWGYIDKTGKVAVEPQFREAAEFSEGLALVAAPDGKWGYINRKGEMTINPEFVCRYADWSSFSEGRAAVRRHDGGKWGYIDETGKMVIEAQFSEALPFSNGLAKVWQGDSTRWGYVDKTGAYVWLSAE